MANPQPQAQDRHGTLIQWLDWLSKERNLATAQKRFDHFLRDYNFSDEEVAIARIDLLVAHMMSGDAAQCNRVIERLTYSEQEKQSAVAQWKKLNPQKASRPRTKVITPDPLAFGKAVEPDTSLSDDVHMLGARIAAVATRWKKPLTYQPEKSCKSIRVKRLVFEASEDTDASQLSNLKDNLILHAKMHPDASVLITPGAVEIHDPITSDEWEKPHFKAYVKRPEELTFPEHGVSYVLGPDLDGKPLEKKVSKVLVSGFTGSGKSQHIISLANQLCYKYPPSHIRLALFDVVGLTFAGFKNSPWLLQRPCLDTDTYEPLMDSLLSASRDREKLGMPVEEWNRLNPNKMLPRIVVIVEEFGETVQRVGKTKANEVLTSLARVARKQAVDLIICTQIVEKDDFDITLLRNLPDRVVFKPADIGGSYTAFGYNEDCATSLQGMGDGFLKNGRTPIRFQSLYLGEDDGKKLTEQIKLWGINQYGTFQEPDLEDEDVWAELELATRTDEPKNLDEQRYQRILENDPEYSAGTISQTEFCMRVFADEGIEREKMTGNTLKTRLRWVEELKTKYGDD